MEQREKKSGWGCLVGGEDPNASG